MNTDDVRAAIEEHRCVVAGVPYQFRLEWCATEQYVEATSARTLLNIECIATADNNTDQVSLHVVVWLADVANLHGILRDALHTQLAHRQATKTELDHPGTGNHRWRETC
jgi:hypothetical protein